MTRPAASGVARIDAATSAALREVRVKPADYARFFAKPLQRVFALGPHDR